MNSEKVLDNEQIRKVERDLKSYPDWLISLEASGLGIPARKIPIGGCSYSFSSTVESLAELTDDIERKVFIIERVYDRLHTKIRKIIELKYFREYNRDELLKELNISKRQYYNLRDRALECFARALGYID